MSEQWRDRDAVTGLKIDPDAPPGTYGYRVYPPKKTLRAMWDELRGLARDKEEFRVQLLPDGGLSIVRGSDPIWRRHWWQR